jgi:hypothetical protein
MMRLSITTFSSGGSPLVSFSDAAQNLRDDEQQNYPNGKSRAESS